MRKTIFIAQFVKEFVIPRAGRESVNIIIIYAEIVNIIIIMIFAILAVLQILNGRINTMVDLCFTLALGTVCSVLIVFLLCLPNDEEGNDND